MSVNEIACGALNRKAARRQKREEVSLVLFEG